MVHTNPAFSVTNDQFFNDCCLMLDKSNARYDKFILLGDLNFDMLCSRTCETLSSVCDLFDMENLIQSPTRFTANGQMLF